MEVKTTILSRATKQVGDTTINFEFERNTNGVKPSTIKATVARQNNVAGGLSKPSTYINSTHNVSAGTTTINATNTLASDAEVIAAIFEGFESILESYEEEGGEDGSESDAK